MTDICKASENAGAGSDAITGKQKRIEFILGYCDKKQKTGCAGCKVGETIENITGKKCMEICLSTYLTYEDLGRICYTVSRAEKEEHEKLCERRRKADIIEHYCTNRKANCERCKVGEMIENFTEKKCVNVSVANLADDVLETVSKAVYLQENKTHERDSVDHPEHYNGGGIECIDAMIAAYGSEVVKSFCLCNAFKYIWRADKKNGIEDIKKAVWYLNKLIELDGESNDD